MITSKNAQATAVLAGLIWSLNDEQRDALVIEPYLNGREDGFAIANRRLKAVFSESRNSDSIVIYLGYSTEFSMQGNCMATAIVTVGWALPCLMLIGWAVIKSCRER